MSVIVYLLFLYKITVIMFMISITIISSYLPSRATSKFLG